MRASDVSIEEVLRWGWLATAAAVMVWDHDTCVAVATRGVELAREAGALTVLAVSANVMAQAVRWAESSAGRHSLVAEADSVTEATGARVAPYGALVLAGLQGREAEASGLIDATIEEFTAGGQGTAVQYARWARSVLLNGLGRYREAIVAAQEASDDTPELFVSVWAAIELLEAATRCDEAELARAALERIVAATARRAHRLGAGDRGAVAGAAERGRRRPSACTERRSSGSAARGCAPSSPALICSTASGCAARIAASTRARSSAPPTSCSPRSAWRRSRSAPRRELQATGETVRKRTVRDS